MWTGFPQVRMTRLSYFMSILSCNIFNDWLTFSGIVLHGSSDVNKDNRYWFNPSL
jgi:hypothetical protein